MTSFPLPSFQPNTLSNAAVNPASPNLVVTMTSSRDLSAAVFGFEYGINTTGYVFSVNTAGAVSRQTITASWASLGVVANDVVNVRAYYNLDVLDGVGTRVYGPAIPAVVESATISGTATSGQTLTAAHGVIAGASGMTVTYQWKHAEGGAYANIGGATASTFVLTDTQIGSTIKVNVSGGNAAGDALSTATGAIARWVTLSAETIGTPTADGSTGTGFSTTTASGTAYYIVIGNNETAPTIAQVKSGVSYTGATKYAAGSKAVGASPFTFDAITGLSATTNYDIYMMQESAGGLQSAVSAKVDLLTISAYDSSASAIFAAMSPSPSDNYKTAINTCVVALKAAGVWAKLDRLWVLAGPDDSATSNNVLLDWVTATGDTLGKTGTMTWTAKVGIAGNGSTGVLTGGTNYSSLAQFTQDAAHLSVWSNTVGQNGSGEFGYSSSSNNFIRSRNAADLTSWAVNTTSSVNTVSNTVGSGMFIANRDSSATTQLFHNPANMTPLGTGVLSSAAVAAVKPTVLAANGSFSTKQIAMASIGGNLNSGTLAVDFYNAVSTLLTAIAAL